MNEYESGQSQSIWMDTYVVPDFRPLDTDLIADVCIVGAGIAGLSTAYLLAKEGKNVVILDDGRICSGQTERTTAHLANAIDDRYYEIERMHGQHGAQMAAESHTAAIDFIEQTVLDEAIDCDFERLDGYLFLGKNDTVETLNKELEAAQRAGLKEVEMLPWAPLHFFNSGPCLRFPQQGQFHPLKYLAGLLNAVLKRQGRIYTQTHVTEIKSGEPAFIKTATGFSVTADAVVVATNTPINDQFAIHTKQAPYSTYAIGARVPEGSITKALYWDTLDAYHYVRLQKAQNRNDEILIIGGEDHKTGVEPEGDPHERLEKWARARFPVIKSIDYKWSGQVMEPFDGLAFIGRNPFDKPNVYICTGDSGMGMTHGTIAGMLLTDLLQGRHNPWASLYDPSRKMIHSAGTYAKENLKVAGHLAEYLTGGEVDSVDEIEPGCGAILRHGLTKAAVYKDDHGSCHEMSAACPHLGCIVHWNAHEKTWDCPCHGSRFECDGTVINGPANSDLEKVGEEEHAHSG